MKCNISILLIVVFSYQIKAQYDKNSIIDVYRNYWKNQPKEYSVLKTDKDIYYTGDQIHFTFAVFDQLLNLSTGISKIFYVSLIDSSGTIATVPFQSETGLASGKLEVTGELKTGNYQLVAYTNFMKSQDFHFQSQRIPIYIQNILEDEKPMGKSLKYSGTKISRENIEMALSTYENMLECRIEKRVLKPGKYFLISEGIKTLQFVTELKVRNAPVKVKVPMELLEGSFQTMYLVNEDLELIGVKYFYQESTPKKLNASVPPELNVNQKSAVALSGVENFISLLMLKKFDQKADQEALFKRMYRIYFNIPMNESLDQYSVEELVSDSIMGRFALYAFDKWESMVSGGQSIALGEIEKSLVIKGKIEMEEYPKDHRLSLFLIKNQIELFADFDESGNFEMVVSSKFPKALGKDIGLFEIVNDEFEDINDPFKVTINRDELIPFVEFDEFLTKEETVDLIKDEKEFKYAISTLKYASQDEEFFWENFRFDETINADDFILDKTTQFVNEALPMVWMRKDGDRRTLRMYDDLNQKNYQGEPILIVDNDIVDAEYMLNLPFEQIDKVHQVSDYYNLKEMGTPFQNGVLIFSMRDGYESNKEMIKEKNNFNTFYKPEATNIVYDFSDCLHLDFNNSNGIEANIRSTNEPGDYQVHVEYFDNKGNYATWEKIISIQ